VRGIVEAVRADVSPAERKRMQDRPTEVEEAYSHWLRGIDYLRRESRKDWEMAEDLFATAVELDPGFVKAWERLVYVRGLLGVSRMDTVSLSGAQEALSRLRSLGRNLPETHAAEGWYAFWVQGDLDRASREFEVLREERPEHAEILWAAARIHRRATRWEESAAALEQLLILDPRNPEVPALLASVRAAQRRFEEAEHYIDQALSLAPDNHFYYVRKWRVLALGQGDTARAGELIAEAEPHVRQAEHAWLRAVVEEFRRNFPAAIEGFASWPAISRTKYLFVSRLAERMDWTETAKAHADSLERIATDRLERAIRLQNVRQMAVAHYEMARVHTIYGRHEEAIREGKEGLRLMPLETFANAPSLAKGLVWIYARAGHHRKAVQLLERILEVPGGETTHALRFNPMYDALRDDPGFRALARGAGAS
jgi:tetratricopeptide (TPR) repeat protein